MLKFFASPYTKDSLVFPLQLMTPLRALLVTAVLITHLAAGAQVPKRDDGFRPFAITSAKTKKEMSSDQIEKTFMCKVTTSVLAEGMDLLQNYDLLGSEKSQDGSASMTHFKGRQGNKTVPVTFVVDNSNQRLSWVFVDLQPALSCRY